MGSYKLIDSILHYTGDGWQSVRLTHKQIIEFKNGTLNKEDLNWE